MQTPRQSRVALPQFAFLNSIALNGVSVTDVGDAGLGLTFSNESYSPHLPLLKVNKDLVACSQTIEDAAKADVHLREALAAADKFARTPRGAVMIFLVVRMTAGVGVSDAWSDYVKFLSEVSLPTTWTDAERELLRGTSLHVAVEAKLQALADEFEMFRTATIGISWCRNVWWDSGALTLADWKRVDAWFRSRVLQFPKVGAGMAPMIDFANHSSAANAYYTEDESGNVVLLPRSAASLQEGEEITINYGEEKPAAEFLFSYGFLDDLANPDRNVAVLSIGCPDDDPLKLAKEAVFKSAPILRISEAGFECAFIWLACVNEEDGLSFRVLQENSGQRKLVVMWNEEVLEDVTTLRDVLEKSSLWPVYQLRAEQLVQQRLTEQLSELAWPSQEQQDEGSSADFERAYQHARDNGEIGEWVWTQARMLRTVEKQLLDKAVTRAHAQTMKLFGTDVVQQYLEQMQQANLS